MYKWRMRPVRSCGLKGSTFSPQIHQLPADKGTQQFSPGALKRFFLLCQFSAGGSILKCWARLSLRKARNPGRRGRGGNQQRWHDFLQQVSIRLMGTACRGRFPPSQVRLEPESAQLFQDSIKQLQHGNHEFQDKNNNIHGTHTRLLWYRARPAGVPFRRLLPARVYADYRDTLPCPEDISVFVDVTQCSLGVKADGTTRFSRTLLRR